MINCPYCGKLTDPKLSNCPHCHMSMRAKPPKPSGKTAEHQCPHCGNPVQDGDIICVRCGTNLLTGHKIADEQKEEVVREKRRRWPLAAALILLFLAALAGAGVYYYVSQDPVAEARRLSRDGNPLEAINVLTAYTESHPEDYEAKLLQGKLHWELKQYNRAAQAFDAVSIATPENADAGLMAAVAWGRLQDDAAREARMAALRRVAASGRDTGEAAYLLALAEGAARNGVLPLEAIKEVSEAAPSQARPRMFLGIAKALQGDYNGAQEDLDAALNADSANPDIPAALGFLNDLAERPADAAAILELALGSGSTIQGLIGARLGILYMSQGDYERALPLIREAMGRPDAPPSAAFFYALCLQTIGLDTEAIAELEKVVTAGGPFASEAAVQMALLYMAQGMLDRANDALRRAGGAATARAQTVQGLIRMREGDYNAAQQAFRGAIRLEPQYAPAYLENGLLSIARGVIAEGLRDLERYLELIGEDTTGTRANEIRLLVEQLKQTVEQAPSPAAPFAPVQPSTSSE